MRKLLFFLFILLIPSLAEAAFVDIDDCDKIPAAQRVTYGTFCLQRTTTGGRSAGTTWVWSGSVWTASGGGGGGTPGGSNTQVQYNDSNVFAGDGGMVYDNATSVLSVTGDVIVGTQSVCREDGTNCPPAGSEADPVVGAINGIVKADGAGNISAAAPITDYQAPIPDSAALAGALSDETGTGLAVFNNTPTLTTPTIGSFTNATHNHTNAAGGGQITDAALSAAVTVPKGGTGQTTLTNHGVVLGQGASAVAVTSAGTAGQVLTSNGASADPTFQAIPAPIEADTMATVFARGKQVTSGANSFANRFGVGDGGAGCGIYVDGTLGPRFVCWPASGVENDLDKDISLNSGKTFAFKDSSGTSKGTFTESTGVWTNFSINSEGSGNSITTVAYLTWEGASCENTTATPNMDGPTSGASTATCFGTTTTFGTLSFADGSTQRRTRHFKLHPNWTGTVDIDLVWFANAASSNAVRWSVALGCVADSEVINSGPSYNTASASNTAYTGTANQRKTTSFTNVATTNCAAAESLWLSVERIGGDAGDTLAATAELVEVGVRLRKSK